MGTILDYLKEYGDYTFAEKSLNEVDSLILSQFAYLKFDNIVPGVAEEKASVTIGYLNAHQDREKLFADERYREPNMELFNGMLQSARFSTLRMNAYINIIDPQNEMQFSAITYILDDKSVYIAYRGTDETIVGWKEDFNMAFSHPFSGQIRSVEYLNQVAARFSGEFYVGGHSKGGNLATYAAMNCCPEIQSRIYRIYSHDGPGFRPEIRERGHYEQIADRVVKIIPQSSLVGMLLESHAEGYVVIKSKTFGLLQHNPYTWLVKGNQFVRAEGIYKGSQFRDNTLNEWILSLDEEHMRTFVDTLYEVVAASKAETLIDFSADWKKNTTAVINAFKELDEETSAILKQIVASLFELLRERTKEELQEIAEEGRSKLEKRVGIKHRKRRDQVSVERHRDKK